MRKFLNSNNGHSHNHCCICINSYNRKHNYSHCQAKKNDCLQITLEKTNSYVQS